MNALRENPVLQQLARRLGAQQPPPACRKHRHPSKGAAEAHIRSIIRRGSDWYREEQLHPYQCGRCGGWHVGHNVKEARA